MCYLHCKDDLLHELFCRWFGLVGFLLYWMWLGGGFSGSGFLSVRMFFPYFSTLFYAVGTSLLSFFGVITLTESHHLNNSFYSICVYFWQVDEIFFVHNGLVLGFDVKVS